MKGLARGRRRLVIVASDLDRLDPDHVEFLLTDTRLSNADVARAYALRNWVEVFYGDGKGELALAGSQVRYEDAYARHWAMVFLAHTLVMYHRMKGSFCGLAEKGVESFRAGVRVIRSLLELTLLAWLRFKKNREVFMDMLGVICAREKGYPRLATVRI